MYDNEILSELKYEISHYMETPLLYVKTIIHSKRLDTYEKINALHRISATPITKSNTFSKLDPTFKRIWLVTAHISSVDFITSNIEHAYSFERISILHSVAESIITNYELIPEKYKGEIGRPIYLIEEILKAIRKIYPTEFGHNEGHISFPYMLYKQYPQCVHYIVKQFDFEWYCCDHTVLMLLIKDVDVDTSLWENDYIKIVNRVKLTAPHESIIYQAVK